MKQLSLRQTTKAAVGWLWRKECACEEKRENRPNRLEGEKNRLVKKEKKNS
jgi:hypothetical protein